MPNVETRSVERSLRDAHEAMSELERLIGMMQCDVHGPSVADDPNKRPAPSGLVELADHISGRIVSANRDLAALRNRLTDGGNVLEMPERTARGAQIGHDY